MTSEELDARAEETLALLEERRAYHQAMIKRERAWRALPWYKRVFARP